MFAIFEHKVMSGSGNSSSPFYYGNTFFTKCSTGVAGLGARRIFIRKCYRRVDMCSSMLIEINFINTIFIRIHFGINMELFIGESACTAVNMCDNTHINIHLHILWIKLICSPICFCCVTGNLNIIIKVKDTNRDSGKDSIAALIIIVGTIYRYISRVCFSLGRRSVRCGKSICELHLVKLPVVYIVKVYNSINRLNCFNLVGFKLHPID